MKRFQLQLGIKNTGKLGFNTTGNSQTSGRTSTAVSLGKLRNTVGSTSRKFKYCNRNSPDLNFTFRCVFDIPTPPPSGKLQIAVGDNAFSISSDYGLTWTPKPEFSSYGLRTVAISEDGTYILTGGNSTPLFYSNDGGLTFNPANGTPVTDYWFQISVSKSGQYQTATGPANTVYVSNNYGMSFTSITISGIFGSNSFLAMSYNGKYQSITLGQSIYISNNYGQIWSNIDISGITNPPIQLQGISMSGNGQIQMAVDGTGSGYIYKSTDYGNTWTNIYTITEANSFYFISISASGQYQLIPNYNAGGTINGGSIWISNDYGVNWTNSININGIPQPTFGVRGWYPSGISESGKYQTVGDYDGDGIGPSGGYIYTSSDYGNNWFVRPTAGQAQWWGIYIN
jgi:photosystem II stability/assembly factor-like uncharacterized protein